MKSLISFLFFIVFAVTVTFAQSEATAVKGSTGCSKGSEAKACCAKGNATATAATETKACCAKGGAAATSATEGKACCAKGKGAASSCKGDKASADVSGSAGEVVEEQTAPVKVVRRVTQKGVQPKSAQD
ncbi:MAG: hypothetical protein K1X92_06915 [Bacteroidia bacterium]|nr:hypothetical protein [Bacteroidia bacterium]